MFQSLEEVAEKWLLFEGRRWEYGIFEVSLEDLVFDMNTLVVDGWQPVRPVGRGEWLFKRRV